MTLPSMNRIRWIIVAIILLGIIERVLWNGMRTTTGAEGEAFNVARAIAEGRGFADAYRIGSGPTAHLTPVSPLIAGGVYRLFGVRSLPSEMLLATWSIGLALGAHLLLYRAFGRIGVPRDLRLGALAWGCLAPTYISQEAVEFRVWEGGLATFMIALFLDRLTALEAHYAAGVRARSRPALTAAALGGALFLINPPMGLGAIACLALVAWRRLSLGATAATAATGAATIALLVAPWAIRNERVLGAPVPLRSNAGLELALSNYDGAETVTDQRLAYLDRIDAVHPTISDAGYRRLRAVGEVAYADALGDEALDWMARHPGRVTVQAVDHMREMIFPSVWKFDPVGQSRASWFKVPLARLAGIVGLLGMLVALARIGGGASYPAIYMTTVIVLMSPFQPVVRYMYVISPVLVNFMACAGLLVPRVASVRRDAAVSRTASSRSSRRRSA